MLVKSNVVATLFQRFVSVTR